MCRKPCSECPWTKNDQHSKNWPNYVKSLDSINKIKDGEHACHMITKDVWGYESEINEDNICLGSKLNSKK